MPKKNYKFYKNKTTRYHHPSLEIESNTEKWKNLEVTSSPTTSWRYIKLRNNPNGSDKESYVRKYIREDPIQTRGQLLKKYHLPEEDLEEIEKYIARNIKS